MGDSASVDLRGALRTCRSCPPARRERGASLAMTLVWTATALIGALTVVRTIVGAMALEAQARETELAYAAATDVIEGFYAYEFSTVYARFNGISGDDPATGPCPGQGFSVEGLSPVDGDPDGLVGEIEFPHNPGHNPAGLSERDWGNFPGMPLDLNLDGDTSDNSLKSEAAVLLPVLVTIRWAGTTGERSIELYTVLAEQ